LETRVSPCHALTFDLNQLFFKHLARVLNNTILNSILPPGLNCIMWPIDNVVGRVSARVQQLVCDCGTKTKDNVFVSVQVIVQYQVIITQAYDAYYKLTDPNLQIRS
jgi:regulator of protease activity HflC (stomatin/prohibitin superfamily)